MHVSADYDRGRGQSSISEGRMSMKIVIVNDEGKTEIRSCRKIEPATLSVGKIIVDEDEVIDLRDVIKIVEG